MDLFLRAVHSPCMQPMQLYLLQTVAAATVLGLGDLYSRRTPEWQERRRRFLTLAVAAIVLCVGALFSMFAGACEAGPPCSQGLDVRCDARFPAGYLILSTTLPFVSMAVVMGEAIRGLLPGPHHRAHRVLRFWS